MADFPPVFCLTLREYFYRRKATQQEFDRQGIKPQWVNGINGTAAGICAAVPHDYKEDGTKVFIHPKVLAICLSQIFALQWAVAHDIEEFFIMEDDVVLVPKFKEVWDKVRRSMPAHINVVQCAVTCWEDKDPTPINEYLEHRNWPFCATCNWWRRDAAEFALKTVFPLNSPIDVIYADRVFPFLGHAITRERAAFDKTVMGKDGKWPTTCTRMITDE